MLVVSFEMGRQDPSTKDVGCRSNFDPSRPLYTQDTSFSVKSSLTAVCQGVQTLSTDIFALDSSVLLVHNLGQQYRCMSLVVSGRSPYGASVYLILVRTWYEVEWTENVKKKCDDLVHGASVTRYAS